MRSALWLISILSISFSNCDDLPKNGTEKKKIKGQQFSKQTMVAKVVGGQVPDEIMQMLKDPTYQPKPSKVAPKENEKPPPYLETENVKTIVTKMSIPLSVNHMDSEWYRNNLRKFLLNNRINISGVDSLESSTNSTPGYDVVVLKLYTSARLRDNLVSILGHLLLLSNQTLTVAQYGAFAQIYDLLVLRRFPVIDLLESLSKLNSGTLQGQLLILFEEMERAFPKHMMSCLTYLLETLQRDVINVDQLLNDDGLDSPELELTNELPLGEPSLNTLQKPIQFTKKILSKIEISFENLLGRPVAAIFTCVANGTIPLGPQLLAAMYLNLPLNINAPDATEAALAIAVGSDITEEEELSVAQATRNLKDFNFTTPHSLIHRILVNILQQNNFENQERYETMLVSLELPEVTYEIRNFDQLSKLKNTTEVVVSTLLQIIAGNSSKAEVEAKETILSALSDGSLSIPNNQMYQYNSMTPQDLLISSLSKALKTKPSRAIAIAIKTTIAYTKFRNLIHRKAFLLPQDLAEIMSVFISSKLGPLAGKLKSYLTDGCPPKDLRYLGPCETPKECAIDVLNYYLTSDLVQNRYCYEAMTQFVGLANHEE